MGTSAMKSKKNNIEGKMEGKKKEIMDGWVAMRPRSDKIVR